MRRALLLAGIAIGSAASPAFAQAGGGDARLNYAFASQLGSGIYDVAGRVVQVYRLPFALPVKDAEDRTAPGLHVNFPVCVGLYDLDPEDVEETGAEEDVATLSFVPGIALSFPLLRNWTLEPFVDLGMAWEFEDSGRAYVYAGGVRSLATFRPSGLEVLVGNRLVYVGEHRSGTEHDEDFATFESGFEIRRPLARAVKGHRVDWGPYAMSYLYLQPTKVWLKEEPLAIGSQYEVGLTVGPAERIDLWRFEVPRLGLGYRFGDGVSASV